MDLDPTLSTALLIVVLAGELWVILRTTSRPGAVEIGDMFSRQFDPAWPRGVQEEDPVPWRPARLTPHLRAADRASRGELTGGSPDAGPPSVDLVTLASGARGD